MTKISLILWFSVFSSDFAAGLWPCAKCNEVPQHGVFPGCTLKVEETGRFHFAFSAECAAARVVEASICAARVGLGAAFLFYDAAFQQMAAYGGTSCFDTSDWSTAFNISSKELFRLQANILEEMDEKSGMELRERIGGGKLECPLATALGAEMPERGVSEEGKERLGAIVDEEVRRWNHEVLNVNEPFWKGTELKGPMQLPRVSCLVPIVWPRQQAFLQAIVETFGGDCDELLFFISSESVSQRDLDSIAARATQVAMSIINLHAWYPVVPPDRDEFHRETGERPKHDTFNTIIKLLHMLRWAGEHRVGQAGHAGSAGQWWYCRLERDTFFIPENFRLLVTSLRLDASKPHYLGVRQFLDLPRTGFVFNDGGPGVCLSQAALSALREVLLATPNELVENPDFQSCALAKGHREDLMLAACLRQAQIFPFPTTDILGREWFSIRPLMAVSTHQPLHSLHTDSPAWNFWTGRGHLFLPCAQKLGQWIVEFAVSFNSFKHTSMFYETWDILNRTASDRWKSLGFTLALSGLRGRKVPRVTALLTSVDLLADHAVATFLVVSSLYIRMCSSVT